MGVELPPRVTIVEVGPRDGLQNISCTVPTPAKVEFIRRLAGAGLPWIEATAFVHPKWVPQMADAAEVLAALPSLGRYPVLIPNVKGLERALEAGAERVAVFTAASETFSRRNTNRSIAESLEDLAAVAARASQARVPVRGYVSTAFVCPYEGDVAPERVAEVCRALLGMGIGEISIGDTIGAAAPTDVHRLLDVLLELAPGERWALHLHDTYGTALANVYAGLTRGVATYDSSAGGLGGCPFAPGAAGNLATEDLVYMLDRMGIETGVDLAGVAEASRFMEGVLEERLPSRQLQRLTSERSSNKM